MCQALHCLPQAGGLLDQDFKIVEGMMFVLMAQQEKQELESKKKKVH